MPYYPYTPLISDPAILFTQEGLRSLEQAHLLQAFGTPTLTADDEEWLKHMTGCQTFLEFRTRIFSPHRVISHDHSILLIETADRGTRRRPAAILQFRALLMNTVGECVALVRRSLNRNSAVVNHDMLEVRAKFERQGVASVLVQSHEDAWEVAGYQKVTLTAGVLDRDRLQFGEAVFAYGESQRDGRIFWGLQGYDLDGKRDPYGTQRIRAAVIHALNSAAADGRLPTAYADNLAQNVGTLPSWDLIAIEDDFGAPIGERAFQAYDWAAFRELNEQWRGRETASITRWKHLIDHPFSP